jgi:hypothetical protein
MVDTRPKFIVGPKLAGHSEMDFWVLLVDYMYWGQETTIDELNEWCEQYLSKGKESMQGSIIQFASEQELSFFILRWS